MELVFVGWNVAEAHLVKGLLENAGLFAQVRNEVLSCLIGELPMTIDSRPSVWVRAEDAPRANELVAEFNRDRIGNGQAWRCAGCGEMLDAQFTECWRCGASRSA